LRAGNRIESVFSFLYLTYVLDLQGNLLKTNPRTLSIAVATFYCSRRRVRSA